MKKVYLVRHAKSSWEELELRDFDRPLNSRGIKDAYLISKWISHNREAPEVMFSSPAARALHTAMIFSRSLSFPFSSIRIHDELYFSSSSGLLDFLRKRKDKFESVMIFSHNPTITDFVNQCQDEVIDNVPTSAMVSLNFHVNSWEEIQMKADLVFFDYPKRLRKKEF